MTLAQTSIEEVPELEKPAKTEPSSPFPSPSTFDQENPPPSDDSPLPSVNNTLEEFDIYRLGIGDGISFTVRNFPEFDFIGVIDPEGNVTIPIYGRLPLVGLTLREAETKISYELSRTFLQNPPEVTATLSLARPAQVTIIGEVVRPGYYALVSGSTLNFALLSAGGSTVNADLRSVVLRRQLVDGTVMSKRVDLYTPLVNGTELPDLGLQSGDTVIVSKLKVGEDANYDRSLIARTTLPQQTITVRVLVPGTTGRAFRNLVLPNGSNFLDVVASLPPEDNLLIKDEVALMRFDSEKGGIVTQEIDSEAAIEGDISQNVPLQDEDVIVVSRTLIGEIFNAFNVITRPVQNFLGFRAFFDLFDDNNNRRGNRLFGF